MQSTSTSWWWVVAVLVMGAIGGCNCRTEPGCLDEYDCGDTSPICCHPVGEPIGPGYCVMTASECRGASCEDSLDCVDGAVCCPSDDGDSECRMAVAGQTTVCGACVTDAHCGPNSVCCGTQAGTVCVAGNRCSPPPPDAMPDAMADAMVDAMEDAMADAMPDGMIDAMPDAMVDAMPDAMVDAMPDAMVDAMVDAMPDAMMNPTGPFATSSSPEECDTDTVEGTVTAGLAAPIRMAFVPGANAITVHNPFNGDILQTIMSSPSNTGAFVIRSGAFAYLLSIGNTGASVRGWTGTQWSMFGQVVFTSGSVNVTDASKVLTAGTVSSAILTDNTNGRIHYLSYDSGQSLWALSRTTDIAANGGARAVSAVAPSGNSPVLVAVDGFPGRLWWVDWSVTPAVQTDLGALGNSPRRMNCSADGTRCFIPNYGSGTVTVVDTSGATPVVLQTVAVGVGPVSVSVATLGGEIVAVVSGFGDDSLTYLVLEPAGIRTVSETLTNCNNPGHAVWVADLDRVLVTCYSDGTYLMRAPPSNVP